MFALLVIAGVCVVSYLIGSLNFAIIVSKFLTKDDVRNHGSGNAGATNMLRTYGKKAAILTAIGDFLKAVVAVMLARFVCSKLGVTLIDVGYLAGIFVVLGHVFPLYYGFRGGKGVMTTLGVMISLNPIVFVIIVGLFVPLILFTKIVSLGSVLGAFIYPFATMGVNYAMREPMLFPTAMATVFAIIVLYSHRDNITRLLNGTERKFGSKK